MKATIVVILSVLFIITGLWFVTSKISESSQENLKKEFLQEENKKEKNNTIKEKKENNSIRPNYQELLSKNKVLESQQKQIKQILQKDSEAKEEAPEYVSEPIDSLLDSTTIEITKSQKEEVQQPEEDFSLDQDIGFKLTGWKLMGTKNNVLVISFKVKNNTAEKIQSKLKVTCSTFDENGDFASTRTGVYSIWLNSGEITDFNDQVLGTVSKKSISIKCVTNNDNKQESSESDLSVEYQKQEAKEDNNDIMSILEE